MLRKAAIPLALLFAITPLAQAHSSATPIEAEDLVLDDEATDTTIAWDGWDIQTVHVREAWMDELGVVVRWVLWGGDTSGMARDHLVTLTFDEPSEYVLGWRSVDNGASWEDVSGPADLDVSVEPPCVGEVLEVSHEQDVLEADQTIPTWNVQFQAFVPFACVPGMDVGTSLNEMVATAYADDATVDVAPGGYYVHGVQEAQDPGAESKRLIDSLPLDGPDRYTKSTLTYADGTLNVAVENLIIASGQHVFVTSTLEPGGEHTHDEEGNHPVGNGQAAEPGQDLNFTAELEPFEVIQVFVTTDLGGRETFWLRSDGAVSTEPLDALPPEEVETPALPMIFTVLALAAVAAARRR